MESGRFQCSFATLTFNCLKRHNDLKYEQNKFGCKLLLPKHENQKYQMSFSIYVQNHNHLNTSFRVANVEM